MTLHVGLLHRSAPDRPQVVQLQAVQHQITEFADERVSQIVSGFLSDATAISGAAEPAGMTTAWLTVKTRIGTKFNYLARRILLWKHCGDWFRTFLSQIGLC